MADQKSASKIQDSELFQRVMKDALAIQDRFAAEPVYSKTGKGYLKSAGTKELEEIKAAAKKTQTKGK